MERTVPITADIHWVGVNDYETELFEALWPLPRGVSYNSYLILDEKVALVDTVKAMGLDDHLAKIRSLLGPDRAIDYLVVNHMEPDHSGSITALRGIFPRMQIVGNRKTAAFLEALYGLTDNLHTVEDGDTLRLGRHTLQFLLAPMLHWPETMVTYDPAERVLFSGDAFGGFGALPEGIFDDEVDLAEVEDETRRYFANILGKHCQPVQKALGRLGGLEIAVVAATHGPVWRKDPRRIIGWYDRWSRQQTEEDATIVYGSMYGHTASMAEAVARGLARAGVAQVRVHNVSRTHGSFILSDVWRYRGLVLGSPTYNTSLFPPVDDLVRLLANLRLKDRAVGVFGTYGWSPGAVKALRQFVEAAKLQLIEPVVEANFSAKAEDLQQCARLGRNLAEAIRG